MGPIIRAMKHNRTRVVLIVLEIALTLAIVTNCVNVILAEREKMAQKSGFDDDNVVWMNVRPFSTEFRQPGALETRIDADLRIIDSVPGVEAAANTHFQLWEGGGSSTGVVAVGNRNVVGTQIYFTTSDIVDALGAKLIAGRPFRESDHGIGAQPDPMNIVIISKALADDLFPDGNAVGKQIVEAMEDGTPNAGDQPRTVVGVMEHFFNPWGIGGANETLATRGMFVPARVGSYERGFAFLIRTKPGEMSSAIGEIEKRLFAAHTGRVFEFLSTPDKKTRWFSASNVIVATLSCIIVALVAVTALGLLGLTSLAVAERTKQIGTRRALGATRGDILRYFLLENWILTTAGLVLGVIGAYALNFVLVSQVSDVKMPWELVAGGMLLLWINGLLSTIPPAVRAMAVPPSIATRSV